MGWGRLSTRVSPALAAPRKTGSLRAETPPGAMTDPVRWEGSLWLGNRSAPRHTGTALFTVGSEQCTMAALESKETSTTAGSHAEHSPEPQDGKDAGSGCDTEAESA